MAAAAETAALAGENETLKQVAALNAAGDRAAAAALLDGATEEPLTAAAFRQDRICNAPERAAARQIERLKAAAPAGGRVPGLGRSALRKAGSRGKGGRSL
ncbi:hypothetical protein ACTTAL_15675 [Rhodobacter capsulatus]